MSRKLVETKCRQKAYNEFAEASQMAPEDLHGRFIIWVVGRLEAQLFQPKPVKEHLQGANQVSQGQALVTHHTCTAAAPLLCKHQAALSQPWPCSLYSGSRVQSSVTATIKFMHMNDKISATLLYTPKGMTILSIHCRVKDLHLT